MSVLLKLLFIAIIVDTLSHTVHFIGIMYYNTQNNV